MKKSRFSEEQIIGIVLEQEAGRPTAEVCRKHGISEATFLRWKAKYGGLEVSEAKRLKRLFTSLVPARAVLAVWHSDDNNVRPHSGLGSATPIKVATRMLPKAGPGHAPVAINARSGHHMRGLPL
ncbi:Transposase [Azospirillum argentinense]|uniref:Uncharacterized protein n=1 Tax=Azospirillum argentinense TaxID=2970906 RepID=A0A5B0KQ65_9PROT|nr:Transposase [Azospirillum argentinense]